jgi:hypothetical protein
MLLMVNGAAPLASVTGCEALLVPITWSAKVRSVFESETVKVPTPLSEMACGLPGALSLIERLAVRSLTPVGLNVTLIVQLAAGATGLPQVLVSAKSPGSAPVKPIPVILSAAVP